MSDKPDGQPVDQILSTDIEHMMPSRYNRTGDVKDINTYLAEDVAEFMTKWLKQIISQKEVKVRMITAPELRVINEALIRADAVIDKGVIVPKEDLELPVLNLAGNVAPPSPPINALKEYIARVADPSETTHEEILMELAIVQAYRQGLSEAKQIVWDSYKANGHATILREAHDDIMDLVNKSEKELDRIKIGDINPYGSPTRHWVHVKTGGGYRELCRGHLQSKDPGHDMITVVVYAGMDGAIWVRPTTDFEDGRFVIAKASKSWFIKMIEKAGGPKQVTVGPGSDVQG